MPTQSADLLPIDAAYETLIQRQWDHLAKPGVWLDGERRVAIAQAGRDARRGVTPRVPLQAVMVEATRKLTIEPATIDQPWIDTVVGDGLDHLVLLEVMSICARLSAIDTFLFGVGHPERPLPTPLPGEPSRERVRDAEFNGGFAQTVGPASPMTALTALPSEAEAMWDLHAAFYLAPREMMDLDIVKDLDRAQLELCAARTSALNECFY
jgi:hypothetical protein